MLRRLVSKFNVSFPSEVCPDVDALEPFRGERNQQFTGDEGVLPRPSVSLVTAPGAHRCPSHQHEDRRGIQDLAAVATLFPEEMKNKHSR